jgi:hypothetical protein
MNRVTDAPNPSDLCFPGYNLYQFSGSVAADLFLAAGLFHLSRNAVSGVDVAVTQELEIR